MGIAEFVVSFEEYNLFVQHLMLSDLNYTKMKVALSPRFDFISFRNSVLNNKKKCIICKVKKWHYEDHWRIFEKRRGPRADPRGTPYWKFCASESNPFIVTNWFLLERFSVSAAICCNLQYQMLYGKLYYLLPFQYF